MTENKRLRARVSVTVLRRIGAIAAVAVALFSAPAHARTDAPRSPKPTDPTVRYEQRLDALIDALESAGTSCEKAAAVLELDSDADLEKLMDDVRDYTADPGAEASFREASVPLIAAVLQTTAWRACAKVTNVGFASAASRHPIFRGSRVARAYVAQLERDVQRFESALAAQGALLKRLDATRGCAARASIVRANTTAKTKQQKAAQDRLLLSEDTEQMQFAASRVAEILPPALTGRVMRACSTDRAFMSAARKHPFLSIVAPVYDARAEVRPPSVRDDVLHKVDELLAKVRKDHTVAKRAHDCTEKAARFEHFEDVRSRLVEQVKSDDIDADGHVWLVAHVDPTLITLGADLQKWSKACATIN